MVIANSYALSEDALMAALPFRPSSPMKNSIVFEIRAQEKRALFTLFFAFFHSYEIGYLGANNCPNRYAARSYCRFALRLPCVATGAGSFES